MPSTLKIITLFVVIGISVLAWALVVHMPKRYRYFIPNGYVGWLCVKHSVTNAMPLEIESGYRIVKFPDSGIIETSSEAMSGEYQDEYWFYSKEGFRKLDTENELGGGYSVAKSEYPSRITSMFWVSKSAKIQQPIYSASNPYQCGPAK